MLGLGPSWGRLLTWQLSSTVITKEALWSQCAVSHNINSKLSGRTKCVDRWYTSTSLKRIVRQSWFKSLENIHEVWTGAGVRACDNHSRDDRSILPGVRRKRTWVLLSGTKNSFQMKFNLHFIWSVMICEAVICWCCFCQHHSYLSGNFWTLQISLYRNIN